MKLRLTLRKVQEAGIVTLDVLCTNICIFLDRAIMIDP